jgi:hypothetical protein
MPDWDDSFSAASWAGFADGQAGNVSRRAASRERGTMKKDFRFAVRFTDTKNVGFITATRNIDRFIAAMSDGCAK